MCVTDNNRSPVLIRRWSPLVLLLIIGNTAPAMARELPLWEAGLGIGALAAPDYRGADEGRTYVLPIPYFVYYGKRWSVGRSGVRGKLFTGARLSFRVSASLGLPADSSRNSARAGMPDLDPTIEIGPSLHIRLDDRDDKNPSVTLRLPLRAVFATDFSHIKSIGWVFLPNVSVRYKNLWPGWNLGISAGPIFATKDYHDYYYSVRPEFATATRPAFAARGGYSGSGVALTLTKRYDGYWVGGFMRYDDLHGAAFEDSPLVRSSHAFLIGIAFSKIFASSPRPARSQPDSP
jgi:outer membrane protein